jgi:hypothetical protein
MLWKRKKNKMTTINSDRCYEKIDSCDYIARGIVLRKRKIIEK